MSEAPYTVAEVAALLRVKPATVAAMTRDGRLAKVAGLGRIRICQCDEVCEDRERDEYGDLTGDTATPCRVPAWHFRWVER